MVNNVTLQEIDEGLYGQHADFFCGRVDCGQWRRKQSGVGEVIKAHDSNLFWDVNTEGFEAHHGAYSPFIAAAKDGIWLFTLFDPGLHDPLGRLLVV